MGSENILQAVMHADELNVAIDQNNKKEIDLTPFIGKEIKNVKIA